mmetsp:Transcript_48397/g.90678  ORF Transcript_48397/g.90678 Transcript_48397/m.90678 type:complete len:272 (+) Transcript_48397:1613-2428(+)
MEEPYKETGGGGVVAEPLHRWERAGRSKQERGDGCDLCQGDGDTHALNGLLDAIWNAQSLVQSVKGPRDHEGIVDANTNEHEGQDLLEHSERNANQHAQSVTSNASQDHKEELEETQEPPTLCPGERLPQEQGTEGSHDIEGNRKQRDVCANGTIQLIIHGSLCLHEHVHVRVALLGQGVLSEMLHEGTLPSFHLLNFGVEDHDHLYCVSASDAVVGIPGYATHAVCRERTRSIWEAWLIHGVQKVTLGLDARGKLSGGTEVAVDAGHEAA